MLEGLQLHLENVAFRVFGGIISRYDESMICKVNCRAIKASGKVVTSNLEKPMRPVTVNFYSFLSWVLNFFFFFIFY